MTQADLADRLQVSVPTVSRWESGVIRPSVGKLIELAEIFETTMDTICGRTASA
jgi:DNA-binding helix-turn-helix protein